MNINLPSPSDLRKFQLESYAEMYKNPRDFKHKIFLRKQIKQLQNDTPNQNIMPVFGVCSINNNDSQVCKNSQKRLERI
jgi:hypothetical protein